MSGRANFIVPKGARVGAKNSCNALGFVVSSPVATLLGSFYNSKIATRSKNKRTNKQTSSALHALRAYVLNSNQSILYLQYFQNLLKKVYAHPTSACGPFILEITTPTLYSKYNIREEKSKSTFALILSVPMYIQHGRLAKVDLEARPSASVRGL